MAAAIRAAVNNFARDSAALWVALDQIGPYEIKLKVGSRQHRQRVTRRDQRAALKKRNRQRNRLAHRRHGK